MNARTRLFAFVSIVLLFALLPIFASAADDTTVTIGEGKTEVTAEDTADYRSAASIRIADGVTHIADGAFRNFFSLTEIQFPDSLQTIGDDAFSFCSGLESAPLPEGLQAIGEQAFYACAKLSSVHIPEGVTSIGTEAFYSSGLRTLIFDAVNCADADARSGYLFTVSYEDATVQIGPKVTRIPACFLEANQLRRLTIPANVTEIGENAFDYCYCLEKVTFENPDTKVPESAFLERVSLIGLNGVENPAEADRPGGLGESTDMAGSDAPSDPAVPDDPTDPNGSPDGWLIFLIGFCSLIYLTQGVLLTVWNLRIARQRTGRNGKPSTPLTVLAAVSPWLLLGIFCWMFLHFTSHKQHKATAAEERTLE